MLQFWYIIAVGLVKLSVLCFYGRIFAIVRFPVSVNILLVLVLAWLVSFLFATFFQVWPLWCNWITCVPTTNYPIMYVCSTVTDIVLDICILCLPAFFLRNLQVSLNKRIGLVGIFGLGVLCAPISPPVSFENCANTASSCVVSSITRLVYTVRFQIADIEGDYASNFSGMFCNSSPSKNPSGSC